MKVENKDQYSFPQCFKRIAIITSMLFVLLFFCIIGIPELNTAQASGAITQSLIDRAMLKYNATNGMYWTYNSSIPGADTAWTGSTHPTGSTTIDESDKEVVWCEYERFYFGGKQCWGFAEFLGWAVTGGQSQSDVPWRSGNWTKYYSKNDYLSAGGLEIGDIIHYNGHSVMVYEVLGDGKFKVAEAWGNSGNRINVGWVEMDESHSTLSYFDQNKGDWQYGLKYNGKNIMAITDHTLIEFYSLDNLDAPVLKERAIVKGNGQLHSENAIPYALNEYNAPLMTIHNSYRDKEFTVDALYHNAFDDSDGANHLWWHTTDGTWINSGDVYFVKSLAQCEEHTGWNLPEGTIQKTNFPLKGSVNMTNRIERVEGKVMKTGYVTYTTEGWLRYNYAVPSTVQEKVHVLNGTAYEYSLAGNVIDQITFGTLDENCFYTFEFEVYCYCNDTADTTRAFSISTDFFVEGSNSPDIPSPEIGFISSSVKHTDRTQPASIVPYGTPCELDGTITSPVNISYISGAVYSDNAVVLGPVLAPASGSYSNVKSVNIYYSEINTGLKFATLDPGRYVFEIHVYFEGGDKVFSYPFEVALPSIPVTGIELNKEQLHLSLTTQKEFTLTPAVFPTGATDKSTTWTSSDPNVATVANGVVTPVSAGEAIITCTANDRSGVCAECKVMVYHLEPPANCEIRQMTEDISFMCAWDSVENVDGYCIWRRESGKPNYAPVTAIQAQFVTGDRKRVHFNGGEKVGSIYDYAISSYINTGSDPAEVWLDDLVHSALSEIGMVKVSLPNPDLHYGGTKQTAEGTVLLSWDHVDMTIQDPDSPVIGYDIYMAAYGADEKDYAYIGSVTAENGTTYVVDGLEAGKTYSFYIKSYRYVAGVKEPSDASSKIYSIEIASMSSPTNFDIEAVSDYSVRLSWDAVEGVDGYNILKSDAIDGEYSVIASLEADATSIVVDQYEAGVTQYYKIRTYTNYVTVGHYLETIYGNCSEIRSITVGKSENEDALLTGIRFDKQTAEVSLGDVLVLRLITVPDTAVMGSALYNCLDDSIAALGEIATDADGYTTVTVISQGSGITSVVCTSTEDAGITAECRIAVYGEHVFTLPASLITVDAEAFANSQADMIVIPNGTTTLGERAFADCPNLRIVCMPDSLTQIADDAFDGSWTVGFVCESDNTAASYAREHSIPCLIRTGN